MLLGGVLLLATACGSWDVPPAASGGFERGEFDPGEAALRRLTDAQYKRIVIGLLGPEVVLPSRLEQDSRLGGLLSVGATTNAVSPTGVERYEDAAYLIAEQAVAKGPARDALVPCTPSGTVDRSCAEAFVQTVGRKLWRRALSDVEVDTFADIAVAVAEDPALGDFYVGLEFALAGLLQSPDFIYRIEVGAPDDNGALRFSDVEMASRLSFFLWGDAPDAELVDVAEAGKLSDPDTLAAQVDRLMKDDRIRHGVRAFFDEMLQLHELDSLEKDPTVFTAFSAALGASAREQTMLDIEALVVDDNEDFRRFLTGSRSHIDRTLAAIYRVAAPSIEGFGVTSLPKAQRRVGFLGQASFLALNSHAASTSAVKRGKFVQEVLLCRFVPPPPPDVNTVLPSATEDLPTLRDRVSVHLEDPVCAGCHQLMDPIGLAFENFDGLGSFRTHEGDAEIDPSGELEGAPFADASELSSIIANDPNFTACLVQTLHRYAVGREAADGERTLVDELAYVFERDGFRLLDLMAAIALDPRFWEAAPQPGEVASTCEPMEES